MLLYQASYLLLKANMNNKNKLSKECSEDILLYRELFKNSSKSLEEFFLSLKNNFSCKKCRRCCKILCKEAPPSQLSGENKIFDKLFVPFGSDKFEDVDISENHKLAQEADDVFVRHVLNTVSKDVFFFRCRYFIDGQCIKNKDSAAFCLGYPNSSTAILDENCVYVMWQKLILEKIENEISKDILKKLEDIKKYRYEFSCNHTGTCCRLACSEYTLEQLKEKASNGDRFACDFVSIFIPYENIEEARKVYPEFVSMMESKTDRVYFYHCPHITEDNLCSIYDKRPKLCRDFPDNPLAILPDSCGYYQWKKEVEYSALLMHALIEICGFYKNKLEYINIVK